MSAARHTFLAKPIAAIALIALAQWLFYDRWWCATLGGFALAWIVAFVVARRDVRRHGPAPVALGGAPGMAEVMVDGPPPLPRVLIWRADPAPTLAFGSASVAAGGRQEGSCTVFGVFVKKKNNM